MYTGSSGGDLIENWLNKVANGVRGLRRNSVSIACFAFDTLIPVSCANWDNFGVNFVPTWSRLDPT